MKLKVFLLTLVGFCLNADGAKILGIFHMCGPSHYLAGSSLMKILAAKGHNVTIIAAFSEKNPPENYNQVVLTGQAEKLKALRPNFFETFHFTLTRPFSFNKMSISLIEDMFNHTEFRKFISINQTFDAVIIEEFQSEAVKYLAHHFKAPLIMYNSMDTNEWTNPYQANPDNPSYIPNFFHEFSCPMSFFERVHNTLYYVYSNLIRVWINIPMHNRLVQKYFPGAPHLDDVIYNVSLVLLNSDDSVHGPIPKVPSMVNVGGFHLKEPIPLPKDLQKVLDDAKEGVIYFSLGSFLKASTMPKDKLEILLKAFSKLKETVLFKFEDENLPGKPENVIIRKWFPQSDILGHGNVKLFITHGGIFGILEAVYHGIPVLALPVFAEQYMNSVRAQTNGYGKFIPFKQLTEDKLTAHLNDVLGNTKYKENAVKRSHIMRDKPIPPKEAVNFWVEYVIRNKGASHFRVAALDLAWYQYLLLDVVIFLLGSVVLVVLVLKNLIKFILKKKIEKDKKE